MCLYYEIITFFLIELSTRDCNWLTHNKIQLANANLGKKKFFFCGLSVFSFSSTSRGTRKMSADSHVIRLKPFEYIHVLNNNTNVTGVVCGPKTFTRQVCFIFFFVFGYVFFFVILS